MATTPVPTPKPVSHSPSPAKPEPARVEARKSEDSPRAAIVIPHSADSPNHSASRDAPSLQAVPGVPPAYMYVYPTDPQFQGIANEQRARSATWSSPG